MATLSVEKFISDDQKYVFPYSSLTECRMQMHTMPFGFAITSGQYSFYDTPETRVGHEGKYAVSSQTSDRSFVVGV